MSRYVAFLRGMNLGRRRITNDELCSCFRAMGFTGVAAYLASGNVIFDAGPDCGPKADNDLAAKIEKGLANSLGYQVRAFVRGANEVRKIGSHQAFTTRELSRSGGKLQVALLSGKPSAASRKTVLALASEADRLAIHGRELFWLPRGNMSDSELDLKAIERALGPMTIRTKRTVDGIVAKYLT